MDTALGLVGEDFVLLACDGAQARSVIRYKSDQDKILVLDEHKAMALVGETGDCEQFGEYIRKNLNLYRLRNQMTLSTHAAAHYTRQEIATALRRAPYQCNALIAGYDADAGASLYFLDYLGSLHSMPAAAHGYGAYFSLSVFDRLARPGMKLDEALWVMRKALEELQTRFLVNYSKFIVKLVSRDGVRVVADAEWKEAQAPGSAAAAGAAGSSSNGGGSAAEAMVTA